MKKDYWSIAFTITVDGLQVDFMELPEQYRIQIMMSLLRGETNGTIFEDTEILEKAVS